MNQPGGIGLMGAQRDAVRQVSQYRAVAGARHDDRLAEQVGFGAENPLGGDGDGKWQARSRGRMGAPHRSEEGQGFVHLRRAAEDVAHAVATLAREPAGSRPLDRKSVVSGTSVSVSIDLGGRRTIKKKKT